MKTFKDLQPGDKVYLISAKLGYSNISVVTSISVKTDFVVLHLFGYSLPFVIDNNKSIHRYKDAIICVNKEDCIDQLKIVIKVAKKVIDRANEAIKNIK